MDRFKQIDYRDVLEKSKKEKPAEEVEDIGQEQAPCQSRLESFWFNTGKKEKLQVIILAVIIFLIVAILLGYFLLGIKKGVPDDVFSKPLEEGYSDEMNP